MVYGLHGPMATPMWMLLDRVASLTPVPVLVPDTAVCACEFAEPASPSVETALVIR